MHYLLFCLVILSSKCQSADFFSQLQFFIENTQSQYLLLAALTETKELNDAILEEKTTTPCNPANPKKIIEKRRTFFNKDLENEKIIKDSTTKKCIFLSGSIDETVYFGGQCPQCFEKFWLKNNLLPEKIVRKNLIAILANHKHKYCTANPNASRVKNL